MSTDKKGSDSLIGAAASQYPGGLDKTQNHIRFDILVLGELQRKVLIKCPP
jgi:hypothetical protein